MASARLNGRLLIFFNRGSTCIISLLLIAGLSACQVNKTPPNAAHAGQREVADRLDYETAVDRRRRVANLAYEVFIDLTVDEERFAGKVTATFNLADSSRDITIDFGRGNVLALEINGKTIGTAYKGFFITLPKELLVDGPNHVSIDFEHPYSEDGTGLHRFVDPEDGRIYLYTYLWPYFANRLFPVFDQPDLKARIKLSVLAPKEWVVVSMSDGAPRSVDDGTAIWEFDQTPPISTYAFSLHAGDFEVWEDIAGEVPIRLMARKSLAEYVAVGEWFEITKSGLDYYEDYFEIAYPFGKYDQLIVPDFNIGGMENVSAVTFNESFVQRQTSDRHERERRATVILHEMAHMWFGNLVTHAWWNGMWLNESFAEQMSYMAQLAVTEFDDTWHGFQVFSKPAAYFRDSRVTTHPIEVPVDSTDDFFNILDEITYEKGGSVLRQLAFYVGEENYRRGVAAYLKEFAFGTTELEDFIRFQSSAAGVDLSGWAAEWLYSTGFNSLSADFECDDDEILALSVNQTGQPGELAARTHKVEVAAHRFIGNRNVDTVTAVLPVERTEISELKGQPCPDLVNPNHGDWTYARMRLSPSAIEVLRNYLSQVEEPMSRSAFLQSLYDEARSGSLPVGDFIDLATALAESESNMRIQQQIASLLGESVRLLERLGLETDSTLERRRNLEEALLRKAMKVRSQDEKRVWFNAWLSIVGTKEGTSTVADVLDGRKTVPEIALSPELRWSMLTVLARSGFDGIEMRLDAELERDKSDFGAKSYLRARASLPQHAIKATYLDELRTPKTVVGLARQRAVMEGLFPARQVSIQETLLPRIIESVITLDAVRDAYFMARYIPQVLAPTCTVKSVSAIQNLLDERSDSLSSTTLRFTQEALQANEECLGLRDLQGQ